MALISIKRNVDLQPGLNAPAVFNCSQGDKGTTIMLGLMNGGNDYTVPSGVTITIRGSRSNGAVFTPTSATFSGSTVSFTLTEEMTDTAGPTLCEAVLSQGNNVLGTANFIINVEASPMGADVPPVFTDAAWTWMLGKLTTETVPALGDDVISSIQGKVDKSQGSTNAKKFLRVNTSGNVSLASTDKTLSVWDQIADAKETGDQIRALDAEIDGVATTLGGSISTLNSITTNLQSSKLDKNQGASNAGKTMVVDSSGNIVPGDALVLKANESTIAPEFDPSGSYTAGQYVYKNGVLYRFTSAHSGAWTGTDAEEVTVGSELNRLEDSGGSGTGLTEDIKTALLACFENVAWINEDGQNYYDALYNALYPSADLVSISAVFTQGSAVIYDTDNLDTLKQYLVVTAHMSDSSTQTVMVYTLSGTLTEGTSTITVSYGGKTTTFDVTVSINLDSVAYGSLTYRDIFVTNNVVPLGDFNEDLNLSSSFQYYHGYNTKRYKINAGSPSQSTDKCVSPTKSLKCFGSSSAQIQYLDSATMSGTYLACLSVNVSRYSAGKAGINVYFTKGVVAIDLSKSAVTDEWEYMVGTGSVSGSNPALSIYIGSMSSANLDSYIDDVIVTPLPSGLSEADALILYKKYLQIMGATV